MMRENKKASWHITDITPRKGKKAEYLNEKEYSLALEKFFSGSEHFVKVGLLNPTPSKVYRASNESLDEVSRVVGSLDGERVLTVGSSFDQVLTAVLSGAKDITLMDANILAKYYAEYKMAMIKNFDFENFVSLMKSGSYLFSPCIFKKIFHDLSEESAQFWGTIFLDQDSSFDTKMRLFHYSYEFEAEFYKSKEAYLKLREKLNDVDLKFCLGEFKDFPKLADGKYGYIDLSNIFDYVSDKSFKRVFDDLYNNNLKDGGKMQIFHSFGMYFPGKKILGDLLSKTYVLNIQPGESSYLLEKSDKKKLFEVELEKD